MDGEGGDEADRASDEEAWPPCSHPEWGGGRDVGILDQVGVDEQQLASDDVAKGRSYDQPHLEDGDVHGGTLGAHRLVHEGGAEAEQWRAAGTVEQLPEDEHKPELGQVAARIFPILPSLAEIFFVQSTQR